MKSKYELQLNLGDTYSIEHVISELKRFPGTELGHVIVNRSHLYNVGLKDLEEIERKVKEKEEKGKEVYFKEDDEYVRESDVTVLNIKLTPFYEERVQEIGEKDRIERIRSAEEARIEKEATIKLEIGKRYPVEHVISELRRFFDDIKLGHAMIKSENVYYVSIKDLEEIEKKVKEKEEKGKEVFFKVDDEYVKESDVTILSLVDPYEKYKKFESFYKEFIREVRLSLEKIKGGTKADATDIIREVIKMELLKDIRLPEPVGSEYLEKFIQDHDFLDTEKISKELRGTVDSENLSKSVDLELKKRISYLKKLTKAVRKEGLFLGMIHFFKRRGITVKIVEVFDFAEKISYTFTMFYKMGIKEEESLKELEKGGKEYWEEAYTEFYESLEKYISENIAKFKDQHIQVAMSDIMSQAKEEGVTITSEIDFFKGLASYFKSVDIKVKLDFNKKLVFFKK